LCFKLYNVREVSAANFYPKPRVDSSIIYLIPKANELNQELSNMITLIMNHKKKKLRNAIMDSAKQLQIGKDQAKAIAGNINDADTRPLHMEPEQILEVAQNLNALVASLE